MKTFNEIKKNLKKNYSGFKKVNVAVLGDSSTQFLTQAIRGMGFDAHLNIVIWESDYSQIERQVFDPSSELYQSKPDIIILFKASHKLLNKYNRLEPKSRHQLASEELNDIQELVTQIGTYSKAKIIYYNYAEIDDAVFGSYGTKNPASFLFQLRKLNYELMLLASKEANLFVCDLSAIQNEIGKRTFFQPSIYIHSEMVLSIDALPMVAQKTLDIIHALNGKVIKCLVLDLDNTLWGGIIGDDGIENIHIGSLGIGKAFSEFQYWLKKLKERGILLAICSKNTESIAKEPFEKHPEMVLRLDDIAIFVANWENKVNNIRYIQKVLNIGFDAIVFIDDNPFERNMVRENIEGIHVPELPEDPADYLEYLYALNLFETISVSSEDDDRTQHYKIEAQRNKIQQSFTNEDDFLKSLTMKSLVEPFNSFNTPRVAQLSQRSNQFNLRTVRYVNADIEKLATSEEHFTFTFTLEDKFGNNGLICIVILYKTDSKKLFVDTWLMSCRVLKRGMEHFVLNTIVEFAIKHGFDTLVGEYIPTAKNEMVKDFYANLGFSKKGKFWKLDVKTFSALKTYITSK